MWLIVKRRCRGLAVRAGEGDDLVVVLTGGQAVVEAAEEAAEERRPCRGILATALPRRSLASPSFMTTATT